jgi:hypothetical protein
MVTEFDWLKIKVNNRLIEPDWLNILVDMYKTKLRHSRRPIVIFEQHA